MMDDISVRKRHLEDKLEEVFPVEALLINLSRKPLTVPFKFNVCLCFILTQINLNKHLKIVINGFFHYCYLGKKYPGVSERQLRKDWSNYWEHGKYDSQLPSFYLMYTNNFEFNCRGHHGNHVCTWVPQQLIKNKLCWSRNLFDRKCMLVYLCKKLYDLREIKRRLSFLVILHIS